MFDCLIVVFYSILQIPGNLIFSDKKQVESGLHNHCSSDTFLCWSRKNEEMEQEMPATNKIFSRYFQMFVIS